MPYRPTPATEEKKARARAAIVAAAERLVAAGGYRSASVAAVARAAGVATGTVYRHFPAKADLLTEVFRRAGRRELAATRAAAGPGAALERVEACVDTFARRALRGRRLAYALLAEPVDPAVEAERLDFRRAYHQLFIEVLDEGIVAGELPPQNTRLTAAALVGAIGEALVGPLSSPDGESEELLVSSLIRFCLAAVSGKEPARVSA